jgi:hypothetical protein
MSTSYAARECVGGQFPGCDPSAQEIFTREDLTPKQQMLGQVDAEFMRAEVFAEKLFRACRGVDCEIPLEVVCVFATDAADRLTHSAKQVVAALAADRAVDHGCLHEVLRLIPQWTFNSVAARRRICRFRD